MKELEQLEFQLSDKNPEVRINALFDACEFGEAGIKLIAQALEDKTREVRQAALVLLAESDKEIAKQALWNYLPFSKMQCLHTITEFNINIPLEYTTKNIKKFAIANYDNTLVVYWDLDYKQSFIHIWDLETASPKINSSLTLHEFSLGKKGEDFVFNYQDGLYVYKANTLKFRKRNKILYPTYQAFAISPGSSLISTANSGVSSTGFAGKLQIKDYESNSYLLQLSFEEIILCNHQNYMPSKTYHLNILQEEILNIPPITFTPDNKLLIAHFIRFGGVNVNGRIYHSEIKIYDVQLGILIKTIGNLPKLTITSVGLYPDRTIIVCGIRENQVCAWELQTDKIIFTTDEMCPCILSNNGRVLIYATANYEIVVRDLVKEQELCKLIGHKAPIAYLTLSEDYEFIASYSTDRQIKIWGIPDL